MSITAVVEKGVIKLPKDTPWPSGTLVRIEPVEEPTPTLLETLKDFDGMAGDLPDDLAANLDRYVHGTETQNPKQIPITQIQVSETPACSARRDWF